MPRKPGVPAYRRRIVRGREIAVVTLRDAATGQRRDHWLGEYGTPESRARYARLVAAWEASARSLPVSQSPLRPGAGPTVTEIMAAYWPTVVARVSSRHASNLRVMLRRWRERYGRHPAAEITPGMLRGWREAIANEVSADAARRATTAVLAMFRWAASYEMVPTDVYHRLKTIEPLRAPSRQRVGPAPEGAIAAVRSIVSAQVRAMIDLQLLTGMRPGEVCVMRPCDIDMTGPVWAYRPATHKTAHHGHERLVYLGPRAQAVLRPFLIGRATTAYCFSPAEARAAWEAAKHALRRTQLSCGNRPSTNRKPEPRRKPGERYTPNSYCRAVARACARARVERWHPHQLRHNYATEVRRRYSLEAARILLGHCSALVTEAVYADRDQQAAMRIAAEIG